jgi:DNA-binding NarL/FixJ family response regulator
MYAQLQRRVQEGRYNLRHRQGHGRHHPDFDPARNEPKVAQQEPTCSIAMIDPKPLTRQSLLEMLARSLPAHVTLIGASSFDELTDGETAALLEGPQPRLNYILLYIRSAGVMNKCVQEQLQLIKAKAPEVPVIIISDRDDSDDVVSALHHGIRGYIPTSIAAEVAIAALTLIEAGGTYVPADALRTEGVELAESPADAYKGADQEEQVEVPEGLNLTSRELAVIDLLREGNANKVIANKLNMRESTVKVHVRNILKKLRVTNRTHAAMVANRLLAQRTTETNALSDIPTTRSD